ncbi:hypothetical protein D3C73_1451520 [compost metagenome]
MADHLLVQISFNFRLSHIEVPAVLSRDRNAVPVKQQLIPVIDGGIPAHIVDLKPQSRLHARIPDRLNRLLHPFREQLF